MRGVVVLALKGFARNVARYEPVSDAFGSNGFGGAPLHERAERDADVIPPLVAMRLLPPADQCPVERAPSARRRRCLANSPHVSL